MRAEAARRDSTAVLICAFVMSVALLLQGCTSPRVVEISPTDADLLSVEEYGQLMSGCLQQKGWDAEADPISGVIATYAESDGEQFSIDFQQCNETFGHTKPVVLSERQWSALYDDYVSAIECLEALGIDMPGPVDEGTFRADGLGAHFAYQHLPADELSRLTTLEAACPQPEVR